MYRCIDSRSHIDRLLGMGCYLTDTDPAKPVYPLSQYSFYVYEYIEGIGVLRPPILPPRSRGGLHIYLLIKGGVDTYNAINTIRRIMRPRRVSYYGLKDSRARSYQAIIVEDPERLYTYIYDRYFEAILIGAAYRHAERKDLVGNCFKIFLDRISDDRDLGKALITIDRISEIGYIPNYYSYQRFGVSRPITHLLGLAIACRSYKTVLEIMVHGFKILSAGFSGDKDLLEGCARILSSAPRWMNIERRACSEYMRSKDPVRSVKSLPKEYISLYISALLSYLFNIYLSKRWRDHGIGLEPIGSEIQMLSRIYGAKIPGVKISLSNDAGMMLKEEIDLMMEILGIKGCDVRRVRTYIERPILLPIAIDRRTWSLEFCLDKGGYATNLLREVFKEHSPSLFSPNLDLGSHDQ